MITSLYNFLGWARWAKFLTSVPAKGIFCDSLLNSFLENYIFPSIQTYQYQSYFCVRNTTERIRLWDERNFSKSFVFFTDVCWPWYLFEIKLFQTSIPYIWNIFWTKVFSVYLFIFNPTKYEGGTFCPHPPLISFKASHLCQEPLIGIILHSW